jgi:hypothetical protein
MMEITTLAPQFSDLLNIGTDRCISLEAFFSQNLGIIIGLTVS